MAFYVPLGPRGFLFRLGTLIVSLRGGFCYWRASRRRALDGWSPQEAAAPVEA